MTGNPHDGARVGWAGLLLVVALGAGLRFFRLGAESLWLDESFSWLWAHQTQGQIWGSAVALNETNPPLYYSIQRLWLTFGDSEAALRSFSALAGTATIPVVFLIGRAVAGSGAGLIAAVFLATSPTHVVFSQNARAYALLMLAATTAVWGVLVFLRSYGGFVAVRCGSNGAAGGRHRHLGLVAYAAGTGVALYTHNTAIFIPLLANAAALWWWAARAGFDRRFALEWVAANVVPFALWLWWLPLVLDQAWSSKKVSWITQPSLKQAISQAARLYGPMYVPLEPPWSGVARLVALGVVPVLALVGLWHWRARWPATATVLVFVLGVPAATWLFGFVIRPIWLERVVLWPLGLGFILAAGGVLAAPTRSVRIVAVGAVIAIHSLNLVAYYSIPGKPPWNRAVADLASAVEDDDAIFYAPSYAWWPLAYYAGRLSDAAPPDSVADARKRLIIAGVELHPLDHALPNLDLRGLDQVDEVAGGTRRAWVIFRNREWIDPDGAALARLRDLGTVTLHARYSRQRPSLFRSEIETYLVTSRGRVSPE